MPIGLWNVLEIHVAVFLACLPNMLPLIRALLGQGFPQKSLNERSHRSTTASPTSKFWTRSSNSSSLKKTGSFASIYNSDTTTTPERIFNRAGRVQTSIEAASIKSGHVELGELESGVNRGLYGISVEHKICWESC